MPLLMNRYCGMCWYFSNAACQAAADSGGRAPVTGRHSVIDRPDPVSRVAPPTITIGSLLAHVRRGDVVRVHSLRRGSAEALETVVHGPADRSRVIGRTVEEISLPDGATISAIVRGEQVIIAHHDTRIEEEDHVIVFLVDRRQVEAVERLFQAE